jgi:hypothetical protein
LPLPPIACFRLKVANELRETDYVDALHVLAVDHEAGLAVAPDASGGNHGGAVHIREWYCVVLVLRARRGR